MHLILLIQDRLLVSSGIADWDTARVRAAADRAETDFSSMVAGVFPDVGRCTKLLLIRTEEEVLALPLVQDDAVYDLLLVKSRAAAAVVDATGLNPQPGVFASPILDEWLGELEQLAPPPADEADPFSLVVVFAVTVMVATGIWMWIAR